MGMDANTIDHLCRTHADLPLLIARSIAKRAPVQITGAELEPAAWEGLYRAAVTWRPELGATFESWARHRITGAIIDEQRRIDHQSRAWRRRQKALDAARDQLTARHGRHISRTEAATAAGISSQDYARHWAQRTRLISLDLPESDAAHATRDPAPTPDEIIDTTDIWRWTRAAVTALPEREHRIITGMYWARKGVNELGTELGVHESRISQIHGRAKTMIGDALAWHLKGAPGAPLTPRRAKSRDAYRHAVRLAYDHLGANRCPAPATP